MNDTIYPQEIIDLSKIIDDKLKLDNSLRNEFNNCVIDEIETDISICKLKLDTTNYMLKITSAKVVANNECIHFYRLLTKYYKSMPECLTELKNIVATYKLMDGQLCSPNEIIENNLKKFIIPYREDQKCSVCYINNSEKTLCSHNVCFKCRHKILQKSNKCPICREKCLDQYYVDSDDDN